MTKEEVVKKEAVKKSYVVVSSFIDKQNNDKVYKKGDSFPASTSKKRLNELSTKENKQKQVFIKEQG